TVAASMDDAVRAAAAYAEPGDAVLLSPGCASFDWYGSYAERGDDFARAVGELLGEDARAGRS
ncbi:MAG: UDP-N-acetylmuramoyl-L-alanine--D-glutamate ligase, partial [Acidimicrobiia bacterium]|nr:UDP-N-acetylmuramoyl-L-alanine--D-glutamate ligase [Acidimicrobiia bacterium]